MVWGPFMRVRRLCNIFVLRYEDFYELFTRLDWSNLDQQLHRVLSDSS